MREGKSLIKKERHAIDGGKDKNKRFCYIVIFLNTSGV